MMNAPKTIEELPCELTPDELHLKSKELCRLAKERGALEERKKLEAAALKSQIDAKDELMHKLVDEIHTGKELRPIECYERPRYGEEKVDVIRTDTGAVVSTRGMHPTERQMALDVGELSTPKNERPKRRKEVDEGTH